MGNGRFLDDDLSPTISQFTASSVRDGQVGLAVKTGSGSAVGLAGGAYTGSLDCQYRVEIDSIAGGAEVGQATFRWRDGSVTGWNASGVLTSASPVTLNSGVTMKWTTGAGADFVVGDRWDFLTAAFFGFRQLIDRDPDTGFCTKTLASPEWIRRDLGAATRVTACLIDFHNLTAAATVAIKGNAADTWGAPSYSLAIPWGSRSDAGLIWIRHISIGGWKSRIHPTPMEISGASGSWERIFEPAGELRSRLGAGPRGHGDDRQDRCRGPAPPGAVCAGRADGLVSADAAAG